MTKTFIGSLSLLVLTVAIVGFLEVDAKSKSSVVLDGLLKNYGPHTLRPVYDESTVTTVIMRLLVTQIIDLEERDQTLMLSGWLKWIWFDENLKWKRWKNPGVTKLLVPTDQIWMPDINLITNVDVGFERYKVREAVVYPNGRVEYASPAILTFTCKINARIFPFDRQVCQMSFHSWNYHLEELDILPSNSSDSEQNRFANNGIWELKKIKVRRYIDYYIFGSEIKPYPIMVYSLYLKRHPLHHILSILVPCLLLSVMNLLVYLLPPEAGEKIGLGMTNLLALVLFQELVAQTLPPSSDNSPIISYYFTPMTVLSCIAIVNAVVVLKLFYYGRHDNPVPHWMKLMLVKCLAPLVCFQQIAYDDDAGKSKSDPEIDARKSKRALRKSNNLPQKQQKEEDEKKDSGEKENGGFHIDDEEPKDDAIRKNHIATDWQNVALIWDKLMLIIMSLLTIISLVVVVALYVIEIHENDIEFELDEGKEVEAGGII